MNEITDLAARVGAAIVETPFLKLAAVVTVAGGVLVSFKWLWTHCAAPTLRYCRGRPKFHARVLSVTTADDDEGKAHAHFSLMVHAHNRYTESMLVTFVDVTEPAGALVVTTAAWGESSNRCVLNWRVAPRKSEERICDVRLPIELRDIPALHVLIGTDSAFPLACGTWHRTAKVV